MQISYRKLVRDRIPQIIEANGQQPVTHVLDEESYRAALLEKLTEETREARQAAAGELAGELADVLEVLQALAAAHNLAWDGILAVAARKRAGRGAFERRIFLEYVEEAG